MDRDELLKHVLALSPDDREVIASALEESFQGPCFANPAVAAAWMVELERRSLAVERGEVTTANWRTSLDRLRARPTGAD